MIPNSIYKQYLGTYPPELPPLRRITFTIFTHSLNLHGSEMTIIYS